MVPKSSFDAETHEWTTTVEALHKRIMRLEQSLRDIRAKAEQAPLEQGEALCDLMKSISESATKALQVRKVKES